MWLQKSPTYHLQRPTKYCSLIIIHPDFTSKKFDYNKLSLGQNYTEHLRSLGTFNQPSLLDSASTCTLVCDGL